MKADLAWQAALGQLQTEMPKSAFETWVKGTQFLSYEDGSFVIGVSNAYARDWLQRRLSSVVTRMFCPAPEAVGGLAWLPQLEKRGQW